MHTSLAEELTHYGIHARSRAVRWFHGNAEPGPELLDYLDLISPARGLTSNVVMPDGVVENQDRPLLYFVNNARLFADEAQQTAQVATLRNALACRGDRAFLAIVQPGSLKVVPVGFGSKLPDGKIFTPNEPSALTFFSRLALGRCEDLPAGPDMPFLFEEMFKLVEQVSLHLEELGLAPADVLSVVGRALFFRFLMDRNIVTDESLPTISHHANSLKECFDTAAAAADTSRWLNEKFNGDLLPLSGDAPATFFASLNPRAFFLLGTVVRGHEVTGANVSQARLSIQWGDLDFAHIPVDLLSQIYEKLCWRWNADAAKRTSVHYTPRNIAATLVGEAFDRLPDAHNARVLDPACGAGVFLVLAFRRLYRELWEKNKSRPDTKAIRRILETQLVGFDISDSALKLTALSLYLTAIELEPEPTPVEKLRFKNMRKGPHSMLFDWRKPDDSTHGPVIGSLGDHVGKHFDGSFDLVLCNPPWTKIEKKYSSIANELNIASRQVVAGLDAEIGKTYQNPNSVPDLPFLWRSSQWCKPGGRIAMALPARTLFQQGKTTRVAREAIFRLIEVTGIINASNLRKTKVWPEMAQPFMLFFARNNRPKAKHRLSFICPHTDQKHNQFGETRIDSESAQRVEVEATFAEPWLWKAMAVGSVLDVEVIRKIRAADGKPLEDYWKGLGLVCSNGYKVGEGQKQYNAHAMKVLPNLDTAASQFRFEVDTAQLPLFDRNTLNRTRGTENAADALQAYRGPLVLIKEAPGLKRDRGRALYSDKDVAYNESYYGYSSAGSPSAPLLTKYLQLFIHSNLWLYYALLTSAKLGVERPNINKEDIDEFPFFPFERFTEEQQNNVSALSQRLFNEDLSVFQDIDNFFAFLYGLDENDVEVINDTLTIREPNDELGIRASQFPTSQEVKLFLQRVTAFLRPFFKALGIKPQITLWKDSAEINSQFLVLLLTNIGNSPEEPGSVFRKKILPLANETGATRIIQKTSQGLIIGLLRQYRYWTPSRARLLGMEILRNHMAVFEEQ